MKRVPYTYTVLRYVHDPAAGESMNVGVLVYAPEERFVEAEFEHTYSRLSGAFAGFDAAQYREALRSFKRAVTKLQRFLEKGSLVESEVPKTALDVVRQFWPDQYLSFRAGELLGGLTHDLQSVTMQVFDRFVASQFVRKVYERRDERQLWEAIRPKFRKDALEHLRPTTVEAKYMHYTFEHTFTNEKLHVIEPVSLDYADPSSIIETATKWRGRLDVLSSNPVARTGHFYLVLGRPKPQHKSEADKARGILLESDVKPEVIEEQKAPDFAAQFSQFVLTHI